MLKLKFNVSIYSYSFICSRCLLLPYFIGYILTFIKVLIMLLFLRQKKIPRLPWAFNEKEVFYLSNSVEGSSSIEISGLFSSSRDSSSTTSS